MTEEKLYYTAPNDKCFNEVKEAALKIWREYPYPSEKIKQIEGMDNIRDNFMYIIAMFDDPNQKKLSEKLSDETKEEVSKRISAGGAPSYYNNFTRKEKK